VYYPLEGGEEEDSLYYPQDERGLNKKKKKKFRPARRSCGVPDPTTEEVDASMMVLDEWERSNPGRRLAIHRMMQEANTTEAAAAAAAAGQQILTVKVWWHVMRAGNTPALGAWTRAQVVASINLANQYFATSPFRFQLAGITQTRNVEWFQCKFDEDYATGALLPPAHSPRGLGCTVQCSAVARQLKWRVLLNLSFFLSSLPPPISQSSSTRRCSGGKGPTRSTCTCAT
jgi:hypothetical protein